MMGFLSIIVVVVCVVSITSAARTFRITNRCNQKLWIGIQGNPLIYNGGFDVNARSSKDIRVPDGWVIEKKTFFLSLQSQLYRSFRKADVSGHARDVAQSIEDSLVQQVSCISFSSVRKPLVIYVRWLWCTAERIWSCLQWYRWPATCDTGRIHAQWMGWIRLLWPVQRGRTLGCHGHSADCWSVYLSE